MSTLKIKRENGKIFCPLADSWHIETPEEKVRQEYIKILVEDYGYSLDQMAQEIKVNNSQRGQGKARADIVIWKSKQDKIESKAAFIVVECKAENVRIREEDYYQGYNYASWAGASFFVTTNEKETKYFNVDKDYLPKELVEVVAIPTAEEALNDKKAKDLVCNQRDQGFRDGIANFPEITLAESPFTKEANTGSNADSLLAQYPDLAGVYVSWEAPAEYVMASAKAAGREDLQIVTIDLGDTSARSIATGGMITCSATSRSWDQGTCEAYCAAYALLGKELPSTFVCPVALPVDAHNLLEGYCASYGLDQAPEWLTELVAE